MNKLTISLITLLAVVGTIISICAIDGFSWGQRGGGGFYYNVQEEKTYTGTITAINNVNGRGPVTLDVKTSDGNEIKVRIGPWWYYGQQDVKLAQNDKVSIVGSTCNVQDMIVAKTIKKGDKILTLRDDNGVPIWKGRQGRGYGQGYGKSKGKCDGRGYGYGYRNN